MRQRSIVWIVLVCSLVMLLGGIVVGYFLFAPRSVAVTAAANDGDAQDHDHHDHVDISAAAAKNLGLRLAAVTLSSYRKHLHLPGIVIEKPGQSGLAVTSPIQGIVRQIHKFPGQALSPGDVLFSVQVTDEALESTQLALLETLTRVTVTQREISRLDPLAETGAIVGRRKLEMEYQLKQLQSERDARLQELRLRGLSAEQIEAIVKDRELVGEIEIRLDIGEATLADAAVRLTSSLGSGEPGPGPIYTVEQLNVFPGRSVRKGEELCHIANHHELFLRGEAFESDVPAIRSIARSGWGITAELGDGEGHTKIEDLQITYMDNHVDPETRTFPFYLALPNQVAAEYRDSAGRLFRSWKFKPGQRAHLYVPTEQWNDQIVLPRDAVVRVGPDALVFRLEDEPAAGDSGGESAELGPAAPDERLAQLVDLPEFEMEPVSVHVLHQDTKQCVIAADGELRVGDLVAMNQAYQIYLAWRLQMGGGGGHDHDH